MLPDSGDDHFMCSYDIKGGTTRPVITALPPHRPPDVRWCMVSNMRCSVDAPPAALNIAGCLNRCIRRLRAATRSVVRIAWGNREIDTALDVDVLTRERTREVARNAMELRCGGRWRNAVWVDTTTNAQLLVQPVGRWVSRLDRDSVSGGTSNDIS